MALVSGQYCPKVEHRCLRWLETDGRYAFYRCAEYARPAKCVSARRPMRFCMDKDEYVRPPETLPALGQSWTDAQRVCASAGKRVCFESEWQFACEGEEMRPYPYGFTRDADACNADRVDIYRLDGQLRDLREGPDGHARCVSPFGIHHLSGNLEEWTTIDGSVPPRPAMKGAYWQPSRNHCRAAQTAHDHFYHGTETGFRCCSDVRERGGRP
jgi:formylglycine-generating enzyme required for sulfatase activity